jgi:hypothetical protein
MSFGQLGHIKKNAARRPRDCAYVQRLEAHDENAQGIDVVPVLQGPAAGLARGFLAAWELFDHLHQKSWSATWSSLPLAHGRWPPRVPRRQVGRGLPPEHRLPRDARALPGGHLVFVAVGALPRDWPGHGPGVLVFGLLPLSSDPSPPRPSSPPSLLQTPPMAGRAISVAVFFGPAGVLPVGRVRPPLPACLSWSSSKEKIGPSTCCASQNLCPCLRSYYCA